MLHIVLFIISVLVLLAGCAIIFMDVVVSYKTDHCQDAIPAEYVGNVDCDVNKTNKRSGFFIFAVPEFRYVYDGKKYQEKSANIFFHFYLKEGGLVVPFRGGKTYSIFVNPSDPSMFITSGEQRITFLRILGCTVVLVGLVFVLNVMRTPTF